MERFAVIPQPLFWEKNGEDLKIEGKISYADSALEPVAQVLSDVADKLCRIRLTLGDGGIHLELDGQLAPEEYEIVIEENCRIKAGGVEGAHYAAATVVQLLENRDGELYLPKGKIKDQPQSPWRGLMVDLARDWHPAQYLFRYVDLCWFYKINRFQLHFTDDESFTLPSRAFPKLSTWGRTYSEQELNLLAEYAAKRGVVLVPEIDFPGHSTQFNALYPEVFGDNGILCCEEKTFEAIDTLLDEICALFPTAPYIHIGGDEAKIAKWDDCPGCVAYRREHGLEDVRAQYAHYVDRLAKMVLAKGKIPIAWEGFDKEHNHMVTKELLVFAWENYYQTAPDLAEGGFTLINSAWKPNYVVTPKASQMWSRKEILQWNPYRWSHWWPNSKAYDTWLTVPESAKVLGGQLNAWGDHLVNYASAYEGTEEEFANVAARLPALAERCWQHHGPVAEDAIWAAVEAKAKVLCEIK